VLTFPFSPRWLIAFATSAVALAGSYTVQVIPPPSGFTEVVMRGINNSGQVIETAFASGLPSSSQVFIGTTSGSTLIPLPAGWSGAQGSAINNMGQVVGSSPSLSQAFIGTTSGSTAIPFPSGWSSAAAVAINDSGQVVGYGTNSDGITQAFIGTRSGSTAIPLPFTLAVGAVAINASGQVAGCSAYDGYVTLFIGVTLISPPDLANCSAIAVNDSGQVVANGFIGAKAQAFIGTTSGSMLIPFPAGANSASVGLGSLSDAGTVVGTSVTNGGGVAPAGEAGWIWNAANGTQLLNNLVPSGWNISNAISISNNGIILAQGSYNGGATQYVELVATGSVPATPAPGSGFLAVIALLFVFAWRFRARLLT
jgi:hypothetical protein